MSCACPEPVVALACPEYNYEAQSERESTVSSWADLEVPQHICRHDRVLNMFQNEGGYASCGCPLQSSWKDASTEPHESRGFMRVVHDHGVETILCFEVSCGLVSEDLPETDELLT